MKKTKFLFTTMVLAALGFGFNACNNTPEPDGPGGDGETTVLYSEDFGTTAVQDGTKWPAVADYDGFTKKGNGAANVTYTNENGLVTLRTNQASKDYEGASGSVNAMMAAGGATLLINDIATCGAKNLTLSFGSVVATETLTVSYKINGTTEWKTIEYTKADTNWGLVKDLKITLPAGANTIKLKFAAGSTQYGTRIDDVKITTTDAVSGPVIDQDGDGGGSGAGEGTEAKPYNVASAKENQGGTKWVEAYIVGNVDGEGKVIATESKFAAPFTVATNILLADSPTETNYANCLPVQLPAGEIREGLNLKDKVGNLGKKVKIYGSLEAYFSVSGLKSVTFYQLADGSTGGTNPSGAILNESFAEGQGRFTIVNVTKPAALERVWHFNEQYKQMAAGAYIDGTNYATEAWLISPAIDLSKVSKATFTFDHAGKQFGASTANLTIQVSTTYTTGDIKASDWKEIAIPSHLEGETNVFKSAGDMDLTEFTGKSNVHIAFKYTSTDKNAGNWYVKNVLVK